MNDKQLKEIQQFLTLQSNGGAQAAPLAEAEVKEIRKNYKVVTNLLTNLFQDKQPMKEKSETIIELFEKLVEIQIKQEEQVTLVKLNNSQIRSENEQILNENQRVIELKDKYSKVCLELGDAIKQVKAGNIQMVESEEANRNQLVENFENSLKDITSKIDEQDKEREEKEKENDELKEELKKKVAEMEEKEKEFMGGLTGKDGEFKSKMETFLDQIKSVETEAQEALKLRQELQLMQQAETEKKLKIAIYSKRINDLVDSLDKTNATLIQFKDNILKMYWKKSKLEEQYQNLHQQAVKGDTALIDIMGNNQKVEKDIEEVKKQKEVLKAKILETQAKIKALKPAAAASAN